VHPLKAFSPIYVVVSGIDAEVNPEQPKNAFSRILVTLSGIIIEVNPVQSLNERLQVGPAGNRLRFWDHQVR
jgi:hypothetical protein